MIGRALRGGEDIRRRAPVSGKHDPVCDEVVVEEGEAEEIVVVFRVGQPHAASGPEGRLHESIDNRELERKLISRGKNELGHRDIGAGVAGCDVVLVRGQSLVGGVECVELRYGGTGCAVSLIHALQSLTLGLGNHLAAHLVAARARRVCRATHGQRSDELASARRRRTGRLGIDAVVTVAGIAEERIARYVAVQASLIRNSIVVADRVSENVVAG